MSVVVVIPVLRRPHRVEPTMQSVKKATREPHRLLFVATENDAEEIAELERLGADFETIPPNRVGDYAKKINHALNVTTEPFIFLGADDLAFHRGWFTAAMQKMAAPRIGVVGTQDLGSPRVLSGEHATHFLVRRAYVEKYGTIDEKGKILFEGYPHEFVDDELKGTALKRRAYAFAPNSVVEHLHPDWGKAPSDDLYKMQSQRMDEGRGLFQRRQKLWM